MQFDCGLCPARVHHDWEFGMHGVIFRSSVEFSLAGPAGRALSSSGCALQGNCEALLILCLFLVHMLMVLARVVMQQKENEGVLNWKVKQALFHNCIENLQEFTKQLQKIMWIEQGHWK